MTDLSATRFLAALDGFDASAGDIDPTETAEWREAFQAVAATHGPARARFLLDELARLARTPQVGWQPELVTLGVLFVLSVYYFPTGVVGRLRAREKTVKTDQARG